MKVRRSPFGSIGLIILVFNILLVFLPVAAFYFLGTYEKQLLRGLERAMSEQALTAASVLRGPAARLRAKAEAFVAGLEGGHEARIRIFSPVGEALADSARLSAAAAAPEATGPTDAAPAAKKAEAGRDSLLYRLGSLPVRLARRIRLGPPKPADAADLFDRQASFAEAPEIAAALAGRYGSTTRILPGPEGSTVRLYSAVPVLAEGEVGAVVLVSQSTSRILGELDAVRLDIFRIFLASALVAVLLSLVADLLLARPLRRLAAAAARLMDGRGRLSGGFPELRAPGEIGLLSRALADMGSRFESRSRFLESFAQDLAHEVRNPLASACASLELLGEGETEAGRRELLARARADLERINRLVGDLREIAEVDAEDAAATAGPCYPAKLCVGLAEGFRARHPGLALELRLGEGVLPGAAAAVDPARLAQALDNLLENAASLSPPSAAVELELGLVGEGALGRWAFAVRDRGPGFAPADVERLFERFYSTRKEGGLHSGLGLAIVKSIAEAAGGSVRAEPAHPGALFVLELPAAPAAAH